MIDLQKVREGDRHLREAVRLDPTITQRPIPLHEIMQSIEPQHTFTPSEAAELTGFSEETIRREIRAGDLKAAEGHPQRISRPELARWWRDRGGGELFDSAE